MIALPTQTPDRLHEVRSRDDALQAVAAAQDVMRALVQLMEAMIEERWEETSRDDTSDCD
jgi:hypothetical protein